MVLATKKLIPDQIPHSRIMIPTQKDAAAIKNKLFDSITELNTSKIATNAVSNPASATILGFTCMRTSRLPYIHTLCPDTTNHSTDCLYHKIDVHIHSLYFDNAVL